MAVTKINEFMKKMGVKGGMSMTTGFDVIFDFGGKNLDFVSKFYSGDSKDVVTMLCDEAQLPNVQSGTAQITGRYLGEGPISYPHTRIFTDLSLGFLLDADLTALKFLSAWYDYIFSEPITGYSNGNLEGALGAKEQNTQRVNRLRYMDDYTCKLRIVKTEPNGTASNGRAPMAYILENCYPYSIDAVPLSYGSSQVTRCTANFYYTRHTVSYANQTENITTQPKTVNGIPIGRDDPFAPVTPENP